LNTPLTVVSASMTLKYPEFPKEKVLLNFALLEQITTKWMEIGYTKTIFVNKNCYGLLRVS